MASRARTYERPSIGYTPDPPDPEVARRVDRPTVADFNGVGGIPMTDTDFAELEHDYLAATRRCADLGQQLHDAETEAQQIADRYHRERRRREARAGAA